MLCIEDDPRVGDYYRGNTLALREKDQPNLDLALLFVHFNPNANYFFRAPPKSQLYSAEEIAEILTQQGHAEDLDQGRIKAAEIIKEGFINFYWAARGPSGVRVVPYRDRSGDTKYRFEVEFLDDGI